MIRGDDLLHERLAIAALWATLALAMFYAWRVVDLEYALERKERVNRDLVDALLTAEWEAATRRSDQSVQDAAE